MHKAGGCAHLCDTGCPADALADYSAQHALRATIHETATDRAVGRQRRDAAN